MIEQKEKKFVDVVDLSEWEVLSDSGWVDIKRIGKTVPYSIWHLRAGEFFLECADEHIVYKEGFEETYVKDLVIGDRIVCQEGIREVTECRDTGVEKPMWDLEVASQDHRYWTSGILSHNTLWMGNIAAKAMQSGNNVAVITLELSDRKYIKRMGANILNVRISEYGDFSENEEALKKRLGTFSFDTLRLPGKLIIKEFPTSQASAVDVENWLKRTEETLGIKFKVVIIDYINIMKNWRNPNSENTYMKIKQIAEDLRAAAQRNEWAIVTATQTKQSEFDASDLTISSASESSGLAATVDGMFGIIQDPIMYSNKEYKLKVIANRDEGYKNSYKRFHVDYGFMRIMEDPNSEIMSDNG